jgi:hypothetical protein
MLESGFLSVCLIHLNFLFMIGCSIGSCSVLSQTSSFLILSYHLMFRILLMQLFTNVCIFCFIVLFITHVLKPYNRTDFTFVLKSLSFVVVFMFFAAHILLSWMNAVLALIILSLTSLSASLLCEQCYPSM